MNFAAAVAGVALVIIGVAAGLYFTMRRRDYEFAALRAMGTDRRQIRATLVLEQAGLLGFALVAGLAIGYWLLRLVMPYVGTSLGVSLPAAGARARLAGARRRGGRDRARDAASRSRPRCAP